jgi:ABC-type transport system involved in multi-copper enzyme maturation permease subunit
MQDKGTIDLYLSRPVARVKLILSRYLAGLILAGSNLAYLIVVTWAIMSWKTHVVQPRFFLGGAVIFFTIAMLMAFAFLVGVITSSTAVSIMSTFAVAIFGLMLSGHARMEAMVSKEWQAAMIKTFYWVFPKTAELGAAVFLFVAGDHVPRGFDFQLSWTPFLTTGAFGIICLVLASWLFTRKEF